MQDGFKQVTKDFDIDYFINGLRGAYHSVQVSKREVERYVAWRNVKIPEVLKSDAGDLIPIGTVDNLILFLESKYGTVSFTSGEEPVTETYITLPSSNTMPENIVQRVIDIVTSRFPNAETIPLREMIAAMEKEGVIPADFGFKKPAYFFGALPHLFRLESPGAGRPWNCLRPADSLLVQALLHLLRKQGLSVITPERAVELLKQLRGGKPLKKNARAFGTVAMCLALISGDEALAALLYALTPETQRISALFDSVGKALEGSAFGKHLGNLIATLEIFLCTADVERIMPTLETCSLVARPFEPFFSNDRFKYVDKVDTDITALAHYVIAYYNNPRCCKILRNYANAFSRHKLRAVTMLMNMCFFGDSSWDSFYDVLRAENDASLPTNFLAFNEAIFAREDAKLFDKYWELFLPHVIGRGVFCNEERAAHAFYEVAGTRECSDAQWLVLIAIAESRGEFAMLYREVLSKNEAFLSRLTLNDELNIRLMIALLFASGEAFSELEDAFGALRRNVSAISTRRNRAVLRWLDELWDARRETVNTEILSASYALLKTYPTPPPQTVLDTVLYPDACATLPPYRVIWHYLNTFGGNKEIAALEESFRKYLMRNALPRGGYARKEVYLTLALFVEHTLKSPESRSLNNLYNYPFLCKKYAVLKKLVGDDSPLPESMASVLYQIDEWDAYEQFAKALDVFAATVPVEEPWREEILYATVSNYWDETLNVLLWAQKPILPYRDVLVAFLDRIAARSTLVRRFLQMLLYTEVGARIAGGEDEATLPVRKKSEVREAVRAFEEGQLDLIAYREALYALTDLFVPALSPVIRFEMGADTETLHGIALVLTTKRWVELKNALDAFASHASLVSVLIPCIVLTHYASHIKDLVLYAVKERHPIADALLSHPMVRETLGEVTANYDRSILHALAGDFDAAAQLLPSEVDCLASGHKSYATLSRAIKAREIPDPHTLTDKGVSAPVVTFSFMERADDQGADAARLAADFYSEGVLTVAEKCLTARKIYAFVLDGGKWVGFDTLAFAWGFLEIERELSMERKAEILVEMLEKLPLLQDQQAFCARFAAQFAYIASELPPHLFSKLFARLSYAHGLLFRAYERYEHRDCYAALMLLLGEAVDLMKNTATDTADALARLELIRSRVIAAQQSYEQNAFAARAVELMNRYVMLVAARGTFEVRLLNADRTVEGKHYARAFGDTVFYQIKNVGFERVPDLTLTFTVDGHEESTLQIHPAEILKAGLGPGCVFAGEYTPKLSNPPEDGADVCISVWIEHTEKNENGGETIHRYEAVKGAVEGKLTACRAPSLAYRKKGSAGYLTSLKWKEHLIGREEELDQILGALSNGENVLLYGTNGTGKSSILHHIKNHGLLAEIFGECGDMQPFAAHLISAREGCNEQDVFGSLLTSLGIPKEKTDPIFEQGTCVDDVRLLRLFDDVNTALSRGGTVACVLMDQFERVVASEAVRPELWQSLMEKRHSNFCYVLAGSNEVLYEVATARDLGKSVWRDIFRPFAQIKIGNLGKEAFRTFLTQPRALNGGELTYTEEAIAYLWSYTNGHALYSVLYGNRTLDVMSKRGVKRNVIYPGDVFAAIHATKDEAVENDIGAATASTVWAQIFRNMESDTAAMLVGKTLATLQTEGEQAVSYQRLLLETGEAGGLSEADVHAALDVLQARDFVTAEHGEDGEQATAVTKRYRFRSDLYLEHFLTYSIEMLMNKDTRESARRERLIADVTQELQRGSFSMEQLQRLSAAAPDDFRTTKIEAEKYYESGAIDQSKNLRIENLTINHVSASVDALRTLLGAAEEGSVVDERSLLQCIDAFPRLSLRSPNAQVDENDELGNLDVDGYVNTMTQGIKRAIVLSDGDDKHEAGGLPKYSSLVEWAEKKLDSLSGFTDKDLAYLCSDKVKPENREGILVALYLRSLFDGIPKLPNVKLDYSPVTISMCKALERILKEYHYRLYEDEEIGVKALTLFRIEDYQKCLEEGKEWNPPPIRFEAQPTIGTFSTVLCAMFRIDEQDPDSCGKRGIRERYVKHTPKASDEQWVAYTENLDKARTIRNKTAHVKVVTQKNCDDFIELYFGKKLLEQTRAYAATDV